MADLQLGTIEPEIYERLIDRLGLALDVARTSLRLRNEVPAELELAGLTAAEFELIHAYLNASHAARGTPPMPAAEPPAAPANVVWLRSRAPRKTSRRTAALQIKV